MFKLKNATQHQILKEIWTQDTFTRQKLSHRLNVNRSTISRNIEDLRKEELIIKEGIQNPGETGGRKTEVLKLNEKKACVLGITVVNDRVFGMNIDLKGHIMQEFHIKKKTRKENLLDILYETVEKFSDYFDRLLAVSVSLPGIIDSENGVVVYSHDLKLEKIELKKEIEKRFGLFTYVENDANAGAVSYLFESGMRCSNIIYFMFSFPSEFRTLGGIGSGIVIDKKIYRGSRSAAGEITLDNSWQYSNAFQLHADDLGRFDYPSPGFPDVLKVMTDNLVSRVTTVTSLLDPDKIILGGDITDFSVSLLEHISEEILRGLDFPADETFIEIDHLGLKTIALGGAVSFLNLFFRDYEHAKCVLNDYSARRIQV